MENTTFIYLFGFSFLVLTIILRNYRQKLKYICCEEKVFIFLILSIMAVLIIESGLTLLWMQNGHIINTSLYILQTLDFIFTVIIPMLWLYYCLYRIYHISYVSQLARRLLLIPIILFTISLIATLPGGVAFKINEMNQYERGLAFYGSFVTGFAYILSALILIISKRRLLSKAEFFPYVLVPIIPIISSIIDVVSESPLGLTWAASSLVLLEIQMLVLNNKTNIDHLTDLNNRMALDTYMKRIIQESQNAEKSFGLIMLDIDSFKKVNDQYGHIEGDKALKATANILRECFSGRYFIARYGGDEFTAVIKNCDDGLLDYYLTRLEEERIKQNKALNKPYEIKFSVGALVFEDQEITDAHSLLMQVDKMMYENKSMKKLRY